MALWPFRRKSGRKRPRSGAALSDVEGPPARAQTEGVVTRADSKKKQRTEPNKSTKLQRRARTYSFSPGRNDDLGVEQRRQSPHRAGPSTRRRDEQAGDPAWGRMPTLHHKQGEGRPMRRKSSRRKKEERQRAAEIKAMSNFEPVRPATDSWTSGRVMKKDSKRAKTASGFRGHPTSDVSLPIPGSVHSSLSSESERGAFKVSAFDSLAPRPTLRYAPGTRWTSSRTTDRAQSQRRPLAEKEPIAEETYKDHRRVDDLADDLDARDLRELMEREDRRREKKRQREQDRASRRLARKAEKHKSDEAEARQSGTPPPENLERGVAGRELIGLGIDPASVTVTTSEPEQRASVASHHMPDAPVEDVSVSPAGEPDSRILQPPISSTQRDSTVELAEPPTPVDQPKPQDSNTSLPQSSRLAGILRSKKSRSKSTLASEQERVVPPPPDVIDEEGTLRRASWTSEKRGRFSLTSFLRWGGKSRRGSGAPPSFSNTSREEMQAAAAAQTTAQAQAQALAKLQGEDLSSTPETTGAVYLSRKPSVGAPLRTKSRFKEDLPDFPMSPPDSRVQSPEAEPPLPPVEEQMSPGTGAKPIDIPAPKARSNPLSPSPEPHQSMSMASIDSEASWLSGRVGTRRSAIRDSIARANRLDSELATDSPTNSTQEDLAIADDDYLARLAPHRNSGLLQAPRRSEDGRPSSDEEDFARDSGARWGAVGARPQFVHAHKHDRSTMQSQEGLLNIESGDEEESDSPVTPSAHEKADIQRARSVNVGRGHVRNFSAGSAKLLDVTPRSSVDSKARSPRRRSSGHIA